MEPHKNSYLKLGEFKMQLDLEDLSLSKREELLLHLSKKGNQSYTDLQKLFSKATLSRITNQLIQEGLIKKFKINNSKYYMLTQNGMKTALNISDQVSFLSITEEKLGFRERYAHIVDFYKKYSVDSAFLPEIFRLYSRLENDAEFNNHMNDLLIAIYYIKKNNVQNYSKMPYYTKDELFVHFNIQLDSDRASRINHFITYIVNNFEIMKFQSKNSADYYLDFYDQAGKIIRLLIRDVLEYEMKLAQIAPGFNIIRKIMKEVSKKVLDDYKLIHDDFFFQFGNIIHNQIISILEHNLNRALLSKWEPIQLYFLDPFIPHTERAIAFYNMVQSGRDLNIDVIGQDLDKIFSLKLPGTFYGELDEIELEASKKIAERLGFTHTSDLEFRDIDLVIQNYTNSLDEGKKDPNKVLSLSVLYFLRAIHIENELFRFEGGQSLEDRLKDKNKILIELQKNKSETNLKESLKALDELLTLLPDAPHDLKKKLLYCKAELYFDLMQFPESIELCQQSLALDSEYRYPLYLLVQNYADLGDLENWVLYLEKYNRLEMDERVLSRISIVDYKDLVKQKHPQNKT